MSGMFSLESRFRKGYVPDQVDALFAQARAAYEGASDQGLTPGQIHAAAFDLERAGYVVAEVDGALDRLEAAFVAKARAEFVAAHGQQAWMEHLAERARTLYGRLSRPDGDRFVPGERGAYSYDADDVDALCHRLVAYFDRGEPITSDEVRHASFRRRRGRDGYAQAPVDAFLARAVEVLLGVE